MKKFLSVVLLFVMMLGCTVVEAAKSPSLGFLMFDISDSNYSNISQTGTVKFKLNKPLSILELAEEEMYLSYDAPLDVLTFVDSLCDTELAFSSKTKITDNGKKISSENHTKADVPFKANENLEGYIKANQSVWTDYDLSDSENYRFDSIQYGYNSTKYLTSSSELFEDTDLPFADVYDMVMELMTSQEVNKKLVDSISKNATVTGNSSNVKIHFDDMGLKMYILDILEIAFSESGNNELLDDADLEEIKAAFAMFKIFDDDALVMEYTLDKKGRISKSETELNVNLNVYNIIAMIGEDTGPLTKENSNIDFTISAKTDIKYNAVTIEKPELTEENSIDYITYRYPYYDYEDYEDYEYYEDYYWMYSRVYPDIDSNCIVDGEIRYVCLRSIMEEMGYTVFYENGNIYGETENPYTKYKSLLLTVGGEIASTDIQDVNLDVPVFVKDGVAYISVSDCEKLTGYRNIEESSYDFFNNYGYITFVTEAYYNDYYID